MENKPSKSFEQLPQPTGHPATPEQLGNIPTDPQVQHPEDNPGRRRLIGIGPDGYIFNIDVQRNNAPKPDLATESLVEPVRELVDAGAFDLAPIGEVVDSMRVSYHGLRFSISRVRENRARGKASEIISNTRRKDLMYKELSRAADERNNPQFDTKKERLAATEDARKKASEASTPTIKPETVVERHMDRRQDKKRRKALEKRLDAQIVAGGYQGKKHAEGVTKSERIQQRVAISTSGMSAAEKRYAKHELGSKRNTSPNNTQRTVERQRVKSSSSFEKTIRQPYSARWRAFRRLNAQDSVVEHQQRAQKHLDKAIDIKNNRP